MSRVVRLFCIGALAMLFVYALAAIAGAAFATQPDPEHKVGICHRTASDTNPYVYIEVDEASLSPGHLDNADPGHKPTTWKTDGTFRGVPHVAGDPKDDYLAQSPGACEDITPDPTPTPTEPTPDPTPTEKPTEEPTEKPTPTPSSDDPTPNEPGKPDKDKPTPDTKRPDTLPKTGGGLGLLGVAAALILGGAGAIAWAGRRA